MRLLAVDLGTKRIGIAVGETDPRVVSPRPSLAAQGTLKRDAAQVSALASREETKNVVLGLPLEDGEETRMARVCRQFGALLQAEGLTVHFVDETLSSVEAEAAMLEADIKASVRRKLRDGEAACRILERYLNGESA